MVQLNIQDIKAFEENKIAHQQNTKWRNIHCVVTIISSCLSLIAMVALVFGLII